MRLRSSIKIHNSYINCFSRTFCVLIVLIVIVKYTRADSSKKIKLECLADYLKSRNVADELLESFGKNSTDPLTCTNNIKSKINDFHNEIQYQMETNYLQRPHADCAMGKIIGAESFELSKLHALFVDEKGIGMKFWKYNSKKSKVESIEFQAKEIVDNAIIECKGHDEYGRFFDMYYEKHETEVPENVIIDYCTRDHLVKNGALDPTKLRGFKVNPKSLDTSGIICAGEMQNLMKKMKTDTEKATNVCIKDVFYSNGYFDMILKIEILATLALNEQEKLTERNKFIGSMIELTKKIKTCSMSINS